MSTWLQEAAAQDAAEAAEEYEKTASARALAQELDEAMPGVRQKVEAFYKEHNPDKLSQVDSILFKYKGREEKLLADLAERYGTPGGSPSSNSPTPPPSTNDDSANVSTQALSLPCVLR